MEHVKKGVHGSQVQKLREILKNNFVKIWKQIPKARHTKVKILALKKYVLNYNSSYKELCKITKMCWILYM